MRVNKYVMATVVGIGCVLCGCGGRNYQRVEAAELMSALSENVVIAQQKYVGKYVDMSGILDKIDLNGRYFSIETGDPMRTIYFYMRNDQQSQIMANKSSGGYVSVRGKIRSAEQLLGYTIDVDSVQ